MYFGSFGVQLYFERISLILRTINQKSFLGVHRVEDYEMVCDSPKSRWREDESLAEEFFKDRDEISLFGSLWRCFFYENNVGANRGINATLSEVIITMYFLTFEHWVFTEFFREIFHCIGKLEVNFWHIIITLTTNTLKWADVAI